MNSVSTMRRGLLAAALALPLAARANATPLQVVASFSILADLVRQVGGALVEVTPLVGADADAHVYEPSAQDARRLQQARVLVANGLGFEAWLPRLKAAAGFKGLEIIASQGIKPRSFAAHDGGSAHGHGHHDHDHAHHHHHHDAQDPHAWQDVSNVVAYVRNICAGLSQVDPGNAAQFRARADDFVRRLQALDQRIRQTLAAVPADRRVAVTTHDAFAYYAQAYGLRLVPARGLSTESEPSAREIAQLIDQMRKERIRAVFIENISDPRLMQQLTRETGAVVGGKLYSDALSRAAGLAASYMEMMEANTATFLRALR